MTFSQNLPTVLKAMVSGFFLAYSKLINKAEEFFLLFFLSLSLRSLRRANEIKKNMYLGGGQLLRVPPFYLRPCCVTIPVNI